MSQILVPGVEFCQEGVVGLGHWGRLRGFAPVVGFTCADPALLPPSSGFPELLLDSNVICPINAYLCNLITSNSW